MSECVCNPREKQTCRYHAIHPDGRPYEPGLITPFLNFLHQLDRENMAIIATPENTYGWKEPK